MLSLYTVCAIVGGVILLVQLLMTAIGLADHDLLSGGGDVHDSGFGGDHGGDLLTDSHTDMPGDHDLHDVHDSSWFFQFISIRSMVAALTFFGVCGGLATSMGLPPILSMPVALGGGVAAMVIVAWLMQLLMSMREDGTMHIERAIGQPATVYLPVPGKRSGMGKVMVNMPERSLECNALTDEEELATGAEVQVADILDGNTVLVTRERH
jgi:hypothetical protein